MPRTRPLPNQRRPQQRGAAEQERRFERTGVPPAEPVAPAADPLTHSSAPDPVYGAPSPRPDWREAVITASGLNVLCGIWLIIAPFVLGYSNNDPIWNDILFGAIIGILALVRISGAYRATELSVVNALCGIWLFAAAFWLDSSGIAGANDIVLGIVVFVLAMLSAGASEDANAFAARGRWRR